MKKLLVIETGGTFATGFTGEVRSLNHNQKTIYDYEIVKTRLEKYQFDLEKTRPLYTLSENMTLENLNILLDFLYKLDYSKYTGIIISHGTDTLAYTANLLSMLFSNKGLPIVMVSSNHPLSNPKANGIVNFISALDFIEKTDLNGVFVIYRNFNDIIQVHLASRIKQMNQVIDSYESFKNINLGVMADTDFFMSTSSLSPSREDLLNMNNKKSYQVKLDKKVMLIHPYVGLRYDYFKLDQEIDAIVLGVYHSGTLNSQGIYIDQSVNTLIEKAEKLGIPIFIGELSSKSEHYESIESIKNSEVVFPVYDLSLENLYMKVHIGLGLTDNNKDLYKFVNQENIFFEKVI